MKLLDIGEVSSRSGIPPSTLRYYEEKHLITSVLRHGLRRQYEPNVLLKLSLITLGKAAGFSLDEIAKMFGPDGNPDLPRQDLHAKADEIDKQISRMRTLSKALRHVAECPAPSHLECTSFQRLLKVAKRAPETPSKPPKRSRT